MNICKCGCNQETVSGDFLPGHDQKLRTRLEQDVGGILALEKLISSAKRYAVGDTTGENFQREVRKIFINQKRQ